MVQLAGERHALDPDAAHALRSGSISAENPAAVNHEHLPAIGHAAPKDNAEREALAERPDARALIQAAIDHVNAPMAQFEKLKAFAVIVEDFSIAGGELTPTFKVKRRVIEQHYADKIPGSMPDPLARCGSRRP